MKDEDFCLINQRLDFINLNQIRQEFSSVISEKEMSNLEELVRMYQRYRAGLNEISTKLENLDEDFRLNNDYAPIHSMESRMKSPQSLVGKLVRKKLPIKVNSVQNHIFDVAGIRVIASYIDDVYSVAELLKKQTDIKVIRTHDYIKNPKNNGYRSLQIVFSVPVFQTDGVYDIPVEVQFRTIGMDFWASLEHELVCKNNLDPKIKKQSQLKLKQYASDLNVMDQQMRDIFMQVHHLS